VAFVFGGYRMFLDLDENLSAETLEIAREFGADLAGFVDIESLKHSPSHTMYSKLPIYELGIDTSAAIFYVPSAPILQR
jgi:hypothetical protein